LINLHQLLGQMDRVSEIFKYKSLVFTFSCSTRKIEFNGRY
jgi:hypothetical protein